MKQPNYHLPKFIGVIYKKVESPLQDGSISLQRFNQYCLAVQLFHLQKWKSKIAALPFSNADKQNMERLCSNCDFIPGREEEGEDDSLLEGLSSDSFSYSEIIGKIQLLVNYFCQYEILKDHDQSPLKYEYERVCNNLETLRKEFRLPARFKYNKFVRRDNPFFKGLIEVIIPDEPNPAPTESAPEELVHASEVPAFNSNEAAAQSETSPE